MLAATAALSGVVSCSDQDDIYREFVKEGGYVYPAKAMNPIAVVGFHKVTVTWDIPKDPAVKRARIFWDNYIDSVDVDYSVFTGNSAVAVIENLRDRSYTFDIVNYDGKGNRSLPSEFSAVPYGDNWLKARMERFDVNPYMNGTDAVVVMNDPKVAGQENDAELVATKFRYINKDGERVELDRTLPPDEKSITLPGAKEGKRFEYQSAYKKSDAVDTVWSGNWVKSKLPVLYILHTDGWTVTCTDGQTLNASSGPEHIFDGISDANHRYHSSNNASNRKVFPKILSIDTHAEPGKEPTFTKFCLRRDPIMNRRYIHRWCLFIGDSPYDPNDMNAVNTFGTPAINTESYWSEQASSRGCAHTTGSCFALVFTNSRSGNGYIDLWELECWGYIASEAD